MSSRKSNKEKAAEQDLDNNPEERFLSHNGIELEFINEKPVSKRPDAIPMEFADN